MRKQVLVVFVILALVAVGGMMLVSCAPPSAGVKVKVTNATGGEITNVQVRFTGGSKSSSKLKVAETFETRVNPTSESSLAIEYVDSAGKQHTNEVSVYIEHNYGGKIDVTLQPGDKVTLKSEAKSSFF